MHPLEMRAIDLTVNAVNDLDVYMGKTFKLGDREKDRWSIVKSALLRRLSKEKEELK